MVMIGMLIKTITKFVERDWLSPIQFKHKGQCRSQMPCSFSFVYCFYTNDPDYSKHLCALCNVTLHNVASI